MTSPEKKEAGKKGKKFHTLRHQISMIFTAVLLFSIVTITVINGFFLEKYYISQKVEMLLQAEATLSKLDIEAILEKGDVSVADEIGRDSARNNFSWVITDEANSFEYGWGESKDMLRVRLFGYIYDLEQDKPKGKILRKADNCTIQQIHDRFAGMDYVECWGQFDNGYYYLIRTPLESIRESAGISNKFYFFVGIVIVLFSGMIIMIFTNKITNPISELTKLSRRMSDLDFDARYESSVGNEIDLLGESFNRMSEQLENTISELKSANIKLQKDIEDKVKIDKMRKEFLDNVSHELKTPIALIQGYAEGLKENISDDPESREFYCDVIMDESAKMNKLVKNLLVLNQLESGKDETVMERFDIVSLIQGVLQTMDIMIQQKEAAVIFQEQAPVYVWADEFKVEEVVTNYVSNALNHLEGERQIELKLQMEGEKVKVSVFNTGNPIPEEDIPNLWSKFYKVDKARTREYGGSGIGLSIVKASMEGMNQEFGVQNYENGVEFWFTLDRK